MALDGTLMFGTGIDNSGFERGVNTLSNSASVAIGNITANIVTQFSEAMAQIPRQMIAVGSGFEASMSQVAATMGITAAAEEYTVLSEAAKEMGETTKFSASQAGEALNYLALAGYDAEKAVAALPTVLHVAAAGGMELADASDMITDAMSALGLEMNEMETFADRLAVTAQKSNTSVSQLGQAILTVGGTAKVLTGGVTEMNTALGILADNGIKGSEGGTALRNILTDIGGKTKPAREALDELGISAYDLDGNMRPLKDTFADFKEALDGVSDKDRTRLLTDIFGAMDLKAVNALIDTSSERFDELSGYIEECSGAAEAMAETMSDNLQGDLTIMQSALEGLGIAAYEKFQTPFREAVQSVTEDIGTLTESLNEGELSESFDKISEGFSSIVSSAAELAANNVIPTVVTGFAAIVEHGKEIAAVAAVIGTAFASWKVAAVIVSATTAFQEASLSLKLLEMETGKAGIAQAAYNGELSAGELVTGLLTGKISLATAAQSAFALETIKTTAVIAAQVAVVAALIAGALAFKNYVDNMETAAPADPWYEQAQKNVTALKEEKQAFDDLLDRKKKSNAEDAAEINNIQRLWSELQNYVDETGKVISDNERASEIIGLLNENYNMNIGYIDGQIQGYGELASSMDVYIEKLRTEARIRNGQAAYDEAIRKQDEYNNKRIELEEKLNTKLAEFQAANDNDIKYIFASQIAGLREELAIIDEATEEYQQTIDEYEGLFSSQFGTSSAGYKSTAQLAAENEGRSYYEALREQAEKTAEEQKKATDKLKAEWKSLEHEYAVGIIESEQELYAWKQAIFDKYGDKDLEAHWKYYEDLVGYQKDYAKKSAEEAQKAAEEAQAAHEKQMSDEWNSIAHMQSIGLLSAEEAYKQQLAFIEKYCPEYADKWYDYYKTVTDYQKKAQQEQVESVKTNISELVSKYKEAYKELEGNISSYKSRLMSVGKIFSIDTETDENGNSKKIYSVENLRKQMAEMKKYHEYITKLKSEGASQELLSELTAMDFEDSSFMAKNLAAMSESEFSQINELYKQKEALADELANDLYAPEMKKINDSLVNGILNEFGTLPAELQTIGAESLAEFMTGLTTGDLSGQVNGFTEQFAADCKAGIENAFSDIDLDYSALLSADTYSMGVSAGKAYSNGFNEELAKINAAIAADQRSFSAEYAARSGSANPANSADKSSGQLVLKHTTNVSVNMDGDKVADKVIEKKELIDYRKGE